MRKSIVIPLVLALIVIGMGSVQALPLGQNITISDGMGNMNNSQRGWNRIDREDQEVEPRCGTGQAWDLEGFFQTGSQLTMVGGFNFRNGFSGVQSGDIFIDINGDAQYGPGNKGTGGNNHRAPNTFGYDYVLDLDFSNLTYTIYALTDNSVLRTIAIGRNDESNPWRYVSGGVGIGTGTINYWANLSNNEVGGLLGGRHYAAAVDLSFLPVGTQFTSHFTIGCGNDNLMGSGTIPGNGSSTPVPEPATLLLVGGGLIGLAGLGRRKFRK